ncbi:MAG: DNA-processing protein DprA [Planctomycetota bacterium]
MQRARHAEAPAGQEREALLRLWLARGVGPVLVSRLVEAFGSAADALGASRERLERVPGVGVSRADAVLSAGSLERGVLGEELERAHEIGARFVVMGEDAYPTQLAQVPSAPIVLCVRGELPAERAAGVAIVGSRRASAYGIEQAERFAMGLAGSGFVIISGGARGIDTAAHRATLRVQGFTAVVMGCGLAHAYPPENKELYDDVVNAGGCLISELPTRERVSAENFPRRNRIISGLSLGVLVVEAPASSGALITARVAIDDQRREVMAIPGRVDAKSAEGSNELIRSGSAAMVTSPVHVAELLDAPRRHLAHGTHAARYASAQPPTPSEPEAPAATNLSVSQQRLLHALDEPRTLDALVEDKGFEVGSVLADITVLEIRGLIARRGSLLERR